MATSIVPSEQLNSTTSRPALDPTVAAKSTTTSQGVGVDNSTSASALPDASNTSDGKKDGGADAGGKASAGADANAKTADDNRGGANAPGADVLGAKATAPKTALQMRQDAVDGTGAGEAAGHARVHVNEGAHGHGDDAAGEADGEKRAVGMVGGSGR